MSVDEIDARMAGEPYACPSTHCDFETYSEDRFCDHLSDECDLIEGAKAGRVVMFDGKE